MRGRHVVTLLAMTVGRLDIKYYLRKSSLSKEDLGGFETIV